MDETQLSAPTPSLIAKRGFSYTLMAAVMSALLVGGLGGYLIYPAVNNSNTLINQTADKNPSEGPPVDITPTITTEVAESPFCKEYGTYTIPKEELLEEFLTGPGDTLRDIAKNKLGDETKALDLIEANPILARYEIDDELPMRLKLYIPNNKYNAPDISAFVKARGNISFNKDKPMFGVNAPNSSSGPYIINDSIKESMKDIEAGDCVVAVFGSRGFDPQKVVMEVYKQ